MNSHSQGSIVVRGSTQKQRMRQSDIIDAMQGQDSPHRPPTQATERALLRKLLKTPNVQIQLASLTDVALASSTRLNVNAQYLPLTDPVCDGFEIRLGFIQ